MRTQCKGAISEVARICVKGGKYLMEAPLPVEPYLLEAARVHSEGGEGVADVEDLVAHAGAPQRHRATLRRNTPQGDL